MFYEFQNSLSLNTFKILHGGNINAQNHLHNSFEFVQVTKGILKINVEKKEYCLKKDDALLIFPHQIHEYVSEEENEYTICIFSPELVKSYQSVYLKNSPKSNLFKSEINYAELLSEALGRNVFSVKGLLYSLCGEFHENREYIEKSTTNDALIEKIFKFVEENYSNDCTLSALSKSTSYNYAYLSRCFKSYTGATFVDYVNRYRVNEASYLLKNTNLAVLEVAFKTGFDSLRNFNRVFKKITEKTPKEYRETK
jgi:AraC-like DNA-binding protein/mannose-6-phosphate isomerase-like protein (cupin superfamily)